MFVLHFPLRAQIGQEFKRLLTNLVISVSRHFPSASLLMEALFGGSSTSSSPLRSACRTGTSSTLLTAPGFNHASGGTPTDAMDSDSSLKQKPRGKKSPTRPRVMQEEGLFKVQNCGSDEAEPPVEFSLSEILNCVCLCACVRVVRVVPN